MRTSIGIEETKKKNAFVLNGPVSWIRILFLAGIMNLSRYSIDEDVLV